MVRFVKLKSIVLLLTSLAVISAAVSGTFFYSGLRGTLTEEIHSRAVEEAQGLAARIDARISMQRRAVRLLAAMEPVRQLLQAAAVSDAVARDANLLLDKFAASFAANVCYLLDRSGTVVASSNRNRPDSFVGKNYRFRPYFLEAIQGRPGLYLALGVTSGRRGLYCSYPVVNRDTEAPIGVAVIKAQVDDLEMGLLDREDGVLLLADPNGVVFLASRHSWLYGTLWELPPERLGLIRRSRQFGDRELRWLGLVQLDPSRAVDANGREYLLHRVELPSLPSWQVIYVHDLHAVAGRVSSRALLTAGYVILFWCALVALLAFFLYRWARGEIQVREQLEEKLHRERDFADTLFEAAQSAMVLVDGGEGRIVRANKAAGQITRCKPEELVGRKCHGFLCEAAEGECPVLDKGEEVEAAEGVVRCCDGAELPVLKSVGRIRRNGETYLLESFVDLTAQKEAENSLRESERLYRELSITDGLTGLFNSRHFYDVLEVEISRAERYQRPLSLLMLDLDNFKQFNDLHGHVEGDRLLARMGQIIREATRKSDTACRYGGEEFAVILPETSASQAAIVGERIKDLIAREGFGAGGGLRVTVSVGVAELVPGEKPRDLVARADAALYQAKEAGKNCVRVAC